MCAMASQPSADETLSIQHGFRCVPENGVKVEEVLLAVGEQVGAEFIHSASRMNKAVVVFMKRANLVGRLIASGIFVRDVLVSISPLSTPSTRVVVANLPPFITDDQIRKELSRFGKFASGFRVLSAGFQADAVKHVVSFRRQVFMFLNNNEQQLNVHFKVRHGEGLYAGFASTDSLRCFECGDLGHKSFACPHKGHRRSEGASGGNRGQNAGGKEMQTAEAGPSQSRDGGVDEAGASQARDGGEAEAGSSQARDGGVAEAGPRHAMEGGADDAGPSHAMEGGVAEAGPSHAMEGGVAEAGPSHAIEGGADDTASSQVILVDEESIVGKCKRLGGEEEGVKRKRKKDVDKGTMEMLPVAVGEALNREKGQVVRVGDREEEESESEEEDEELFFSDSSSIGPELTASQPEGSKYTLRELTRFLNETKGKKVNLETFFPDPRKFVRSVQHAMRNEGHGALSPRKRFRLRKWVTIVRKGLPSDTV